ncbi:MAG: hypothetical protein AVDCRST_MAG66-3702, partial [uncultured Pseudonocardia sp.]
WPCGRRRHGTHAVVMRPRRRPASRRASRTCRGGGPLDPTRVRGGRRPWPSGGRCGCP